MSIHKFISVLAAFLISAGLVLASGTASAAEYPSNPIHLIIPFKAGGGTDNIGRGIAKALEEASGVSIVVNNITGGGGVKGNMHVIKSKKNGYTVLMNGTQDITAGLTFKKLPMSLDDFIYIGAFFTSPTYILSHKDRNLKTFEEFLERARANPGKLTIGTAGPRGAQMIMAAAIKGITGVDFRIIPYSGGADLKKALHGNQVDAGIIHAPVMLSAVKAGVINVIGTGMSLSKIGYPPIRGTKTLKDIGIDLEIGITRGIYLPKGTPPAIVAKLTQIVEKAAKSETFAKFGKTYGFAPLWINGADFEKMIRAELDTNRKIKAKYIDK